MPSSVHCTVMGAYRLIINYPPPPPPILSSCCNLNPSVIEGLSNLMPNKFMYSEMLHRVRVLSDCLTLKIKANPSSE